MNFQCFIKQNILKLDCEHVTPVLGREYSGRDRQTVLSNSHQPVSLSKAVNSGFSERLCLRNNEISKTDKPLKKDILILTSAPQASSAHASHIAP